MQILLGIQHMYVTQNGVKFGLEKRAKIFFPGLIKPPPPSFGGKSKPCPEKTPLETRGRKKRCFGHDEVGSRLFHGEDAGSGDDNDDEK
jgi:hypothetical protein